MQHGSSDADGQVVVTVAPMGGDRKLRAEHVGLTLAWEKLGYDVKLKDGSSKEILHGITGEALPGEMFFLMGPRYDSPPTRAPSCSCCLK